MAGVLLEAETGVVVGAGTALIELLTGADDLVLSETETGGQDRTDQVQDIYTS